MTRKRHRLKTTRKRPNPTTRKKKAIAAVGRSLKGKQRGAFFALVQKAKRFDATAADVAALKAKARTEEKAKIISAKLAGGYITKPIAKKLEGMRLKDVKAAASLFTTKMINRIGEEIVPQEQGSDGHSALSDKQEEMVLAGAKRAGMSVDEFRKAMGATRANGATAGAPQFVMPKGGY